MQYIDDVKFHIPLGFSDKYRKLRENVLVKEPAKSYIANKQPVTEKLVKTIWFDQKIERRGLETTDGKKVLVFSPGEWNFDEGPDFRNAKILVDGRVITGDIEVDLYSSNWKSHNHHKNKNFNNVILHVFLRQKNRYSKTLKQNKKSVYAVELINFIDNALEIMDNNFDIENYPYASSARAGKCAAYSLKNFSLLEHIVGLAGDERIQLKSENFAKRLKKETIEEIIYKGILDGLGYGSNRDNFKKLSEILPLRKIRELIKQEKPEPTDIKIQALFLGSAGLIPESEKIQNTDDEAKEYFFKIKKIWEVLGRRINPDDIIKKGSWKFKNLRPYNFPYRRLAAASLITSRYINCGFQEIFRDFYGTVTSGNFKLENFLKNLTTDIPGYWFYRTTFNSKKFTKPVALIGEERILLILINTFLPLAVAETKKPEDKKAIYAWWAKQPAISTNRIARITAWKTGFGNMSGQTERIQQGLLQIFKDFCDTKKGICTGCGFQSILSMPTGKFF
ncbi:MAG: DUF2851 family protein [Elusimicrobia bacterium]|nr:DUF2851 family protein [Elusimicrobiota bacterium]